MDAPGAPSNEVTITVCGQPFGPGEGVRSWHDPDVPTTGQRVCCLG
jgi:hypothetical protein